MRTDRPAGPDPASRAARFSERLRARHPLEPLGRVGAAAAYSLHGGGKRIRPILAELACEALGGTADDCFDYACALEMVHAYSLIHDDLPAMDDDDLRRGRPTNHKVFGEAHAILAGDGLLTLAFETALSAPHPMERNGAAALRLARAAGLAGMVGGQALDMEAEGRGGEIPLDALERIHIMKTGRLLACSAALGALASGAAAAAVDRAERFGLALGLLFQVTDDLLDATGRSDRLGKTAGADAARGKTTYVTALGLDAARRERDRLLHGCLAALDGWERPAGPLAALARRVAERES